MWSKSITYRILLSYTFEGQAKYAEPLKFRERGFLVGTPEAAEAGDIGDKDGGEAALDVPARAGPSS